MGLPCWWVWPFSDLCSRGGFCAGRRVARSRRSRCAPGAARWLHALTVAVTPAEVRARAEQIKALGEKSWRASACSEISTALACCPAGLLPGISLLQARRWIFSLRADEVAGERAQPREEVRAGPVRDTTIGLGKAMCAISSGSTRGGQNPPATFAIGGDKPATMRSFFTLPAWTRRMACSTSGSFMARLAAGKLAAIVPFTADTVHSFNDRARESILAEKDKPSNRFPA